MKISDLFRRDSSVRSVKNDATAEQVSKSQDGARAVGGEEDRVSISSRARQVRIASAVVSEDESAQAKRVQELKEKVANGSYNVSSDDVAKSVANYLSEK